MYKFRLLRIFVASGEQRCQVSGVRFQVSAEVRRQFLGLFVGFWPLTPDSCFSATCQIGDLKP
jgi:hypothetical protein